MFVLEGFGVGFRGFQPVEGTLVWSFKLEPCLTLAVRGTDVGL